MTTTSVSTVHTRQLVQPADQISYLTATFHNQRKRMVLMVEVSAHVTGPVLHYNAQVRE